MEKELLDILNQIVNRIDNIDNKMDSMQQNMDSMQSENQLRFESIDNKFEAMDKKMDEMQRKTDTRFEALDKKIDIIIEVQTSHMKQNEREHREMMKHLEEKTSLLESVIKHSSGEIINLKEGEKSFHEILGRHEKEISTMKRKLG